MLFACNWHFIFSFEITTLHFKCLSCLLVTWWKHTFIADKLAITNKFYSLPICRYFKLICWFTRFSRYTLLKFLFGWIKLHICITKQLLSPITFRFRSFMIESQDCAFCIYTDDSYCRNCSTLGMERSNLLLHKSWGLSNNRRQWAIKSL